MDVIECIMARRSSGRLGEPAPSAGGLADEESVMAWVYLGTEPEGTRPSPRAGADPSTLTTVLDD